MASARPNASAMIMVSVEALAEPAVLLGERHAEQPQVRVLLPQGGAVALGLLHVAHALVEIAVAVGQQPLDAVLQLALLVVEIEIHGSVSPSALRDRRSVLLRAAHAGRGDARADQQRAADAIEDADRPRAAARARAPARRRGRSRWRWRRRAPRRSPRRSASGVQKSTFGSMNWGRNATKKVRLLGFSAVTSQACPSMRAAGARSLRGSALSVPPARHN